jgi:arabinan endo-1,5-alpha-L-arabinosidase
MNLRNTTRSIIALVTCLILVVGYLQTESFASKERYYNPVFEPVLADPSVIQDPKSGLFYAYGTEDHWADDKGRRLVPILESKNLVDWKYIGEAFGTKPTWKQEGGIWAPDINYVNGQYFLYYSYSTWGDENPCIGLAIADHPKGPFVDQGKLFSSEEIDVPNSIDPFYYEEDDKSYLFWGSFSHLPTQGTYAIELTADGKKIKDPSTKTKIAAGDFEAVMIHKKDNYYYFFGSKGSCCNGSNSTYHVMVARSENLLGPYFDRDGKPISERGNGSLVVKGSQKYTGPGHNSHVVTDKKGNDWILYHAIDSQNGKLNNGTSRRVLMLDNLQWDDGWPYIKDFVPSENDHKPDF